MDARNFSPELRELLDMLASVRRRIVANALLRGWTRWAVWLLIGLIAVAVASPKLAGALLFLAALAAIGAAAILFWTWRARLSAYDAARRLDAAAGLKDRTSTAVHLGHIDPPDGPVGMIRRQRKDALARAKTVDARALFPLRWPATIGRAGVLVLVVAGLFAYRIHHQPPLLSLLQTTARSHLVQSILAPLAHAMEMNLQRALAMVTAKPDAAAAEERRSDSAASSDDPWKANENKDAAAKDSQTSAEAGELPQDQLQPTGDPQASAEARQEDGNLQSQEGQSGSDNSGRSQQSDPQGAESRPSLGQSLMQALKNLLSNSQSQQANSRPGPQQPSGQGMPQSGNSQQPGTTDSDKRGESRGSSDSKQKPTQTASEGAGNQPGSKELRKDQDSHPINAVPDRVALEASGFKPQTRMNVATEAGASQLTTREQSPQGDATLNGAEQENIPARYRLYVQRYFEHAEYEKH